MALAEKRICEHTDATTISSADEFIVDSMANGTRNITMTNLENQILSTDTYSALSGIGDGTITGSIADIDSNLNNLTYDSSTNRLTMTGNTAFSGTIDSSPTAGSGNAVSSGGTKTYVDSAVSQLNDDLNGKCSVATYNWNMGSVTADTIYTINNFKSIVGLSNKNIVAVGLVFVAGSSDYDYGAAVIFRSAYDFARIKIAKTQSNTTACLYIIYTD